VKWFSAILLLLLLAGGIEAATALQPYEFVKCWTMPGNSMPRGVAMNDTRLIAVGGYYPGWGGVFDRDGSGWTPFPDPTYLIFPVDVAVNATGYIYVTDRFSTPGIRTDVKKGGSDGTDPGSHMVHIFSPDGIHLDHWDSWMEEGTRYFGSIEGLGIGPNGDVYVADSGDDVIYRFDCNGVYITTYGSEGSPGGGTWQFDDPVDVSVGSDGACYVSDQGNNRIVRFVPGGSWTSWPYDGSYPRMNCLDGAGNLFVVGDFGKYKIQNDALTNGIGSGYAVHKYSSSGTLLAEFGPPDEGDSQIIDGFGVTVDGSGNVYVSSTEMAKYTKWRPVQTPVGGTLSAGFAGYPQSGPAPLAVRFIDYSRGASTWSWDFGDGQTSTDREPVHTYTAPGRYTVTLTVSNGAGATASETKWEYIIVTGGLTADFSANVTSGAAPLAVLFTPDAPGATSWQWYFGDGATSSSETPVHVYLAPGVYTVSLVASMPGYGSATVTKTAYIRVTAPPSVDFVANVTNGTAPLGVGFTDLTTGSPFYWRWDFGDGGTSTLQHPAHLYVAPGVYTVSLTAYAVNGSATGTKTAYITVGAVPTPTVTVTPTVTPTVTATATPTPEPTYDVPGRIQAEDYNEGGEGVAYHDTTPGNIGGVYRNEDVDIERIDTGDPTPNVGWIRVGEWLEYTVNVSGSATYDVTYRVSSNRTGRWFDIYVDDETVPRSRVAVPKTVRTTTVTDVAVPYTVEWQYFTTVTEPLALTAGTHTLHLAFPMDYINFNWMEFGR
jgi:PKD repeat protein